jgi:hypothetical protein
MSLQKKNRPKITGLVVVLTAVENTAIVKKISAKTVVYNHEHCPDVLFC